MKELLSQIGMVFKAMFTEWIPIIANADLGPIGAIGTGLTIFGAIIGLIKLLHKRGR